MGIRESALQIINSVRSTDKLRVVTAEDNSRSISMEDLMEDAAGYFSDVASSGDYDDLLNRPTIPTMGQILNAIYPVGSYYWTSDSNFNPQTAIGGTWEKIDPGVTLVSAGTGYTVQTGTTADGGAKTVTLSENEMPAHTHGEKTLTGSFKARHYGTSGTGAQIVYTPSGIVRIQTDSTDVGKINQGGTSGGRSEIVSINATHEHNSVGSGQAHENMPPYKAAYCWHRIA